MTKLLLRKKAFSLQPATTMSDYRSFPHSWLITGFVARATRRVPLVKQELLPPVFSWVHVTRSVVLCVMFCWSLLINKERIGVDSKVIIKICKSKDRQPNDQKKKVQKDKQRSTKHYTENKRLSRSLLVLLYFFLLVIGLSVLRFTDFDYYFGIYTYSFLIYL
jgi:hypothetical protein